MRPQYAWRANRLLRRYYSSEASSKPSNTLIWGSESFESRLNELKTHYTLSNAENNGLRSMYPRKSPSKNQGIQSFSRFWKRKESEMTLEQHSQEDIRTIFGKVKAVRKHGKALVFINISETDIHGRHTLQVKCGLSDLKNREDLTSEWTRFLETVKIGDVYSFTGFPTLTSTKNVTLQITDVPILFAPSLHQRPEKVLDKQTLARFPQLELELNARKIPLLILRAQIEQSIRNFLNTNKFVNVHTPILAADSGGAIAKPFVTRASHLLEHELCLRIAPELELKKLVAAGMDRVYEIGPSFRNEGMDATHNPEFTTCEFYSTYWNLHRLVEFTQTMFQCIAKQAAPEKAELFAKPFHRISFLSGIENEIRKRGIENFRFKSPLTQDSWRDLVPIFPQLGISEPLVNRQTRTSHVLDLLSSHLLEPLCKEPTIITEYPAIMSPLAKSYICPESGHELSSRAELFINSTEYVNMYEEENDPFAQARKFLTQKMEGDENTNTIETESLSHSQVVERLDAGQRYYIRVLEMGLPPTAGWGCGIERLVMLFGDAERIGDVLPFGNLRNVIAMGT